MTFVQELEESSSKGTVVMPSSPISSAPNTMESKTIQSSDKGQQPQTASTDSTTVTPHQFQEQQSQQTSTNDIVKSQPSSADSNIAADTSATIPTKEQSQHNNLSEHNGFNTAPNIAAATNAMESQPAAAINVAPLITNITPSVPSTPSWASLFANSSNSTTSNLTASLSTSSSTTTNYSKKPVAIVAPYEGLTSVTASTTDQQLQRNPLANIDEYSLKFAEFLKKYQSNRPNISLRPRGLTNRSNYCYINSILQALIGCPPIYNLIRSIPKQAASLCEVKTPTINAMITFMSNFSKLPRNIDYGGCYVQCDSPFEPTEIYKLWNNSREKHFEGRQEDAEEFLSYILNKLNDEMLEVLKLIDNPNGEHDGQNELAEEDGDIFHIICNNVTCETDFGCTPLSDIFRGELRSRLQREGEYPTDVIQPFFTLQLNIKKAASVKEALEILVCRDQLEGVISRITKQEVAAWQQMKLEKLPPVLILQLNCFDYRSYGCTKILKKVDFPVNLKIDAKIMSSEKYSQNQRTYRLFAVVYHDGMQSTKGHYITDVYHTGYGSWLRYDDRSVEQVSESEVLLPPTPRVPYLLCYRRCDTIPQ